MEFIPYKANEILDDIYYQVPIELFINPLYKSLSSASILLYAFLRYRHQLSTMNNWIDEEGNIYLIFPRKELQDKLNLSNEECFSLSKLVQIYYDMQSIEEQEIFFLGSKKAYFFFKKIGILKWVLCRFLEYASNVFVLTPQTHIRMG